MDKELLEKLRGIEGSAKKATIAAATLLSVEAQAAQTDNVYNQELENPNHKIEMTQEAPPKIDEPAFDFNDYRRDVEFQMDTVQNETLRGYYSVDRNTIGIIHNESIDEQNQKLDKERIAVHEQKHADDYANGAMSLDLNPEQKYAAGCHLEVSANIAEFLRVRQEYLENPDKPLNTNSKEDNSLWLAYESAIASGEIVPNSANDAEFDNEMRWIYTNVRQDWEKTTISVYHEAASSRMSDAVVNEHNDENYAKVEEIFYSQNLGGVDFNKYNKEYNEKNGDFSYQNYNDGKMDNDLMAYVKEKNPYQEGMNLEEWHTLNIYAVGAYNMEKYSANTQPGYLDNPDNAKEFFGNIMNDYWIEEASPSLREIFKQQAEASDYNPKPNYLEYKEKVGEMFSDINGVNMSDAALHYETGNMSSLHLNQGNRFSFEFKTIDLPKEKPLESETNAKINEETNSASQVKNEFDPEKYKTRDYYEHGEMGKRVSEPMSIETIDLSSNVVMDSRGKDLSKKSNENDVANKLLELSGQREAPSEPKPVNKTQLTQEQFQEMISQKNDLTQ